MKLYKPLFFLLFVGTCCKICAQQKVIYSWFDKEVGVENTGLFNGIEFIDPFNILDQKHRFFETDEYTKGTLNYDGQNYYDIDLKYDVYEDQLVAKLTTKNGEINQILLLNAKINSFKLGNISFEKLSGREASNNLSQDFHQLLVENEHFRLFKRNHKKLKKFITNNSVYYKFIEVKPEYFIISNDKLFNISKKRDLISLYPQLKRKISKYKWSSRNFDENDRQLISAIQTLGQILTP